MERLRLAEEDERAAAKAQHIAEMEDKFKEMQMEQAAAEGGGSFSSHGGAGGPSGEVEVPDEYLCPITSELMTDPMVTVRCCRSLGPSH